MKSYIAEVTIECRLMICSYQS